MVIREDMVASGVNFLRHPKVQSAPLSQRVTFLEKKGLTQEEIAEALARKDGLRQGPSSSAGGGQASGGSLDDLYGNQPHPLAPPPPPPMYHHEEHPPSPWSNPAVLVPTSLAAGLGLGVAAVQAYRNLWPPQAPEHMGMRSPHLMPPPQSPPRGLQGPGEEQAFAQMGREDEEGFYSGPPPDPMTELARAIERQASALSELAAASEKSRQDLHSFFSTHVASQTHEIRSELSTIKQMLLLNGTYPPSATTTARFAGEGPRLSITSGDSEAQAAGTKGEGLSGGSEEGADVDTAAKKAEDEEEERRRKEGEEKEREARLGRKQAAVRKAVLAMVRQTEGPILSEAADMLTIYLNNLIKYPTVPRFRKVALINQGYKDRVAQVKGHKDFLASVGYSAGASCFEWDWHAAAATDPEVGKENLTVLRSAIELLASAKNGELADEAAQAAREEEEEKEKEKEKEEEKKEDEGERKEEDPTSTDAPTDGTAAAEAPSAASPAQPPLSTATAQADSLPSPSEPTGLLPGQSGLVTPPRQPPTDPSTPFPSVAPVSHSSEEPQPEATGTKAPQYPQSFLEIMEQVKRGETPAGIVAVENRLSVDADALLHAPPTHGPTDEGRRPALLAKPWEHNRTD